MAEDTNIIDEGFTTVWVPDTKFVGYVIGKQGRTITRLMRETSTYIHYDKDINTFIIEGEELENRYTAKLKIKEIISNGLKNISAKCWRFPVIDSKGYGFVLQPVGFDNPAFKVVLKNSLIKDSSDKASADYSSFSNQIFGILQSVYREKKEDVIYNIWSHFGHIYLSNVHDDKEFMEFNAQELLNHVKWDENQSNTTKWRTKFVGGIDGGEPNNLNEWMRTRDEKGVPFIRYEFVYFTPSCQVVRAKIFLGIDRDVATNTLVYKNIPKCEPVANIIRCSDSYPYFYLCGSTTKRAMVDVFQPAEELDFRFIIDSGSTSKDNNTADEEVDVLFNYIKENMKVIPNAGLELPQENLPKDFDPYYARVSERRTYPFISEDEEQFTVKLSYEHIVNRPTATSETTVDIHLQHDEWDKMFEDGTWNPQKIVDKIPEFMKCASSLARILKVQETIPEEILARGPKAQAAYENALKSGKTKYRRVPVMLIGQSRAGKTSLLRSLKREMFNPNEDSTDGVRLHRYLSVAEEDVWLEDIPIETSIVDRTARVVAEKLKAPTGVQDLLAKQENEDDPFCECQSDEVDAQLELSPVEENGDHSLNEETEKEREPQVSVAEEVKEQPVLPRDRTPSMLSHSNSFEKQIPQDVSDKTSTILRNPEEAENEDSIHLVTLDFAGQPVYNATHPVFLPKKGIYILVHSLKNDVHAQARPIAKHGSLERKLDDNCPMTNMDHLEFWLSFVASLWTTEGDSIISDKTLDLLRRGDTTLRQSKLTTGGIQLPKRLPPVFLVFTHADIPFEEKDPKKAARQILGHLKDDKDAPGGKHIVREIYHVNNTVSGKSEEKHVKDLRKHIYQVANSLPHLNEFVPIRWLEFEKELSDLGTIGNKKYLSLDEAKKVATQYHISSDTDEFRTLLNYLHDLKVIIYFEDTDVVIIDIQWLLNMFVKVITVQPIEEWNDEYEDVWQKLEKCGILDQALIDHIWENESTANSLLLIMERFSLLCRWKMCDGQDIFLVPSMLMNSDAKEADTLLSDQKTARTLVVRFKSAHLPLGIFPRLLVIIAKTCNEKWPKSPQPKFFHNFCRFYDIGGETGKSFDLVVTSDMKTVSVSVINEHGIKGLPLKQLCCFLVEFLQKKLNAMRSNFPWMKNIQFEFCIRCPVCYPSSQPCSFHKVSGCTRDACMHFITEDELRKNQLRCYKNDTNLATSFDKETFCDWFEAEVKETNTTKVVAETVQSLLALEGSPSTSEAGSQSQQIVPYEGQELMLPDSNVITLAKCHKLVEELKEYKSSMKDPPPETVKQCRDVCRQIIGERREKLIMEMRKYVPSGTTGPRQDENKPYQQMELKEMQELTKALCGSDTWKKIAVEFGIPTCCFDFLDRSRNPVEDLLKEQCEKRNLTVGELYDILCKCDVNALADKYL